MKNKIIITITVLILLIATYVIYKNLQNRVAYLPGTTIESPSIIDDGNAGE